MPFLATLGKIAKSRSVWGSIGSGFIIVGQAYPHVAHILPAGSKITVILGLIATGVSLYGRIRAKQPLGPIIDQTIADTVTQVHELGIGPAPDPVTKIIQVQAIKQGIAAAKEPLFPATR